MEKLSKSNRRDAGKIMSELAVVLDDVVGLMHQGDFLIGEAYRLLRPPTPHSTRAKPHVLVVDDDAGVLKSLARAFGRRFTVTTASDVEGAIEVIRTVGLDAVVSDYNLTEGTGIDVLRVALRAQPDAVRILHTAQQAAAIPKRLPSHLVQHLVHKPSDSRALAKIIVEATSS